jgi:hypothetical protein
MVQLLPAALHLLLSGHGGTLRYMCQQDAVMFHTPPGRSPVQSNRLLFESVFLFLKEFRHGQMDQMLMLQQPLLRLLQGIMRLDTAEHDGVIFQVACGAALSFGYDLR